MSWINLLESHIRSSGVEKVPPGWLTTRQLAEKMGKSLYVAYHLVTEQARSGWLEKKKFRIQVGDRVVSTPHYRPAKKRR